MKKLYFLFLVFVSLSLLAQTPFVNSNQVYRMITNYSGTVGSGTTVSNANAAGTKLFTNSSIKTLTSTDASVMITDNGLSISLTAPTNGGITSATATNIVDGLLFTPGIAYVRTNGNNANAVVGYPSKPFATITNALNALPSDGGVVDLGKSVFSRITQAFMKDNVTFIGEQTPQFHTNNLYLTNGTVIQGPFNFTNNNIALIRLGVDSGPNVVTNAYGGTPQDAIIVGASPTAAQRFMVRDVVSLGNGSAANAVHLLSFEGNDNMSVQGFEGRGGHHGLVIKSSGANVSDVVIRGAFAEGVFIKSGNNTGQRAANINLNNIRVESMSAIANDTGDAFRMEANQGIEIVNVNVNNFTSTNTQNGVYMLGINTGAGGQATNRISNVSFNNLNITVRTNGYAFLSQGSVRNVKVNNAVIQGGINGVNVGAFWGGDQPDNFQFSNVRQSGATNGWVIAFGLTNRFMMENILVQSNVNYGVWPNPADGLNHGIYANNVRSEYNGGANYVTPIRQIDWSGNGMDTFATNANFYSLAILSTGSGSGLHTTDRSDQTKDYAWYANNGVLRLNTPAGGDWLLITNGTVNSGGMSFGDQIFANGYITRSSVGGYLFADRTTGSKYGQLYADNDYARLFGSDLAGVLFESKLDGTTNWFKGHVGTDGSFFAAGNVRGVQLSATGSITNAGQTFLPNMAAATPDSAVGIEAATGRLVSFAVPSGSTTNNFLAVNVKDFGAVGDGVTDDYAAISNAVAYVSTNSSATTKRVVLPTGDYRITRTIWLSNNVTITSTSGRYGSRVFLAANANTHVFAGFGVTNAAVEDIGIFGFSEGQSLYNLDAYANTNQSSLVFFQLGEGNKVRNCYLHNAQFAGVYVRGVPNFRVEYNTALSNKWGSYVVYSHTGTNSVGGRIAYNTADYDYCDPIRSGDAYITIEGNVVQRPHKRPSFDIGYAGIYLAGEPDVIGNKILNNTIRWCNGNGIDLGPENTTVRTNFLGGHLVMGNTIISNGSAGIVAAISGSRIIGNTIQDNGTPVFQPTTPVSTNAIALEGSKFEVSGNNITDSRPVGSKTQRAIGSNQLSVAVFDNYIGLNTVKGNVSDTVELAASPVNVFAATTADLSTAVNGEAVLGSDYIVSTTMTNTGLTITLPSSGTYQVNASVRSTVQLENANTTQGFIVTQLFNTSAGALISNSERLTLYHNVTNTLGTARSIQATSGFGYLITVSGSSTISLQAKKAGDGTADISAQISSDNNGRSVMNYVKLQ